MLLYNYNITYFSATVGCENFSFQRHSRRVSWQEDSCNIDSEEGSPYDNVRSVAHLKQKRKHIRRQFRN